MIEEGSIGPMTNARAGSITVYYDYTCRYSYRALHWLDLAREARPELEVRWATFSLKEVNRDPEEQPWVMATSPPSVSVFALALAHAAREGDFDRYHRTVFEAMHGEERKIGDEELLRFAGDAGVDPEIAASDRGRWVGSVGGEHRDAVARLGVYGTPTIIQGDSGTYLRLHEVPSSPDAAIGLLDALAGLAASTADLVELFRSGGLKPTPVPIEGPGRGL
jgi:predicted DsbA family dithiol-disulfide isomerase